MGRFNWLHLTDLHWGLKDQKHLWPEIREKFFEDLGELHANCGPWQAVLFSGDFVQQGKKQEFDQLDQLVLGPLWETLRELGSGDAVLLAVPGNHDLERPNYEKAGKKLKSAVRHLLKPEQFSEVAEEVLEDGDSSPEREVIDKAFANYSAWWKSRMEATRHSIQEGTLPGEFSTTFEVDGGFRVGVVGLNSTFLQLAGGDFVGKLALDLRQFHAACKSDGGPSDGPAWSREHDLCLLMTHQGIDWLNDESRNEVYPAINPSGRFAIHLFGHMHEECTRGETIRGGQMRRYWQCNSLFSREPREDGSQFERRHGYAAGSIEFSKDHAILRHWPRKATDKPHWRFIRDDDGCILEDDGGTKPERLELVERNSTGTKEGLDAFPESLDQTIERVLHSYHRNVQQEWDDRWSEVIGDDTSDD